MCNRAAGTKKYDFNGNQTPKFWFGDRVMFLSKKGTIYGMQWRDDNSHPGSPETRESVREEDSPRRISRFGWIYWVHFDNGYGTQGVHEESLELLD